ncbi:MAG: phosphoenolpyruvate--protein phosphotransferase [Nocardioidaceae bacterium]|nr:phosphoenolpyruvate--protein phosphotransferase [Nocardioidaceae bacterium]
MISIVVVSHSRALGDAAVGLASEMVDETSRPLIKVAAGLDETSFGTDASAVAEAISEVDSPDGILLLLDLGSAVLSAEMALEFLAPEVASRVTVSSAPLVEGLVAAVVTAATGADMDTVVAEARQGLAAKQAHLADEPPAASSPGLTPDADTPHVKLMVHNEHGLHARPAAKLVALVRSYDVRVHLTNLDTGRGPIDARSLSRVATLDARQGSTLLAQVTGREADAALAALRQFADDGIGDTAQPVASGTQPPMAAGSGLDVAVGPARCLATDVDVGGYEPGQPEVELGRSGTALSQVRETLVAVRGRTEAEVGPDEASIFDAHLALLDDPEVLEPVATAISSGASAPGAWSDVLGPLAGEFESLADSYQRARAQDVRSVERRLLLALTGRQDETSVGRDAGPPVVLVLPEIDAGTAAAIDPTEVAGVVTLAGGATGHGVIVAKSRGLAIYTDAGEAGARVRNRDVVAFDAAARRLVVNPDDEETAQFRALAVRRQRLRDEAMTVATSSAVTRDGTSVHVVANVGSVREALAAVSHGAEGSGLVRTEVLFGELRAAPGADEQLDSFLALSEALGGRPMTIRTWDVGGDKPLAFLPLSVEANPFLGQRGLRVFRTRPDLLVEQLTAVCRLAAVSPARVMFPMVTTRAEVDWALERLQEAAAATGGAVPDGLEVGVMIEVPAAALRVADLSRGLDFVSIGTNDLTQYTVAAERGNAAVAQLADAFDPAVLRLVRTVCDEVAATTAVAVCGDLASDLDGAALLLGLGVRELSTVGPAVALVKQRVRQLDLQDVRRVAADAVAASSADEVRSLLRTAFATQA